MDAELLREIDQRIDERIDSRMNDVTQAITAIDESNHAIERALRALGRYHRAIAQALSTNAGPADQSAG